MKKIEEQFRIYEMLHRLEIYSEQARWGRLNSFLVIISILLISWSAIFTKTDDIPYKMTILSCLSIIGLFASAAWIVIGKMVNKYHKVYDDACKAIEEEMELHTELEKLPYRLKKPIHDKFEKSKGLGMASATNILIWVPIIFCLVFFALFFISSYSFWVCS